MKPFLRHPCSIGVAALLPLALVLVAACNKESHAGTAKPGDTKTPSMMDQAKSGLAEFEKSSKDALASVDQKIAELRTKAASATESAKVEIDDALASLDEKRRAIGNRISELRTEAPDKIQAGMDKLKADLADLKESAEDAVERFK